MPKTRLPYAPEFRRQMIELVRAGRNSEDFADYWHNLAAQTNEQTLAAFAIFVQRAKGRAAHLDVSPEMDERAIQPQPPAPIP
jgi:hypothetical protein